MNTVVHLGFEVGTGEPVSIPLRHMAVTGQTQEAGKTTALEALIARSGVKGIAFITKRGEGSFANARTIAPYFREQADWQYVASILEASRGEKLKFERAWIIRASKGARSLADVHRNVRRALEDPKTRGMSADVYLTLDAYLEVVVPQIERVRWATSVKLGSGLNVVDLTPLNLEMQHLVIRSTIDWVLNHETDTVVVVPEAWKFIPQGRGTPVKLAAESFARQGAGLRNYLWLDSQDIAGVDKPTLKMVPVWILGVQREANEIKRTLAQIPAGIKKPNAADIATLELGQFYACYGRQTTKVYVQPEWMNDAQAQQVANGQLSLAHASALSPRVSSNEDTVNEREAAVLRTENETLRKQVAALEAQLQHAPSSNDKVPESAPASGYRDRGDAGSTPVGTAVVGEDALYARFKERLANDAPAMLRVLVGKPSIDVEVTREVIRVDGKSTRGRIARLIAEGFFAKATTSALIQAELSRRGSTPSNIELGNELKSLTEMGFFTRDNKWINLVPGMNVNVVER